MASEELFANAQTLRSCQLCENAFDIRWKCLSCNLLLCKNCKLNIHSKFKDGDYHKIIDIKDVGTEVEQTQCYISPGKCSMHDLQDFCLYCETCKSLVCPLCVSVSHIGHEMTDINQACSDILEKVSSLEHKACAVFMPMYEKDIVALNEIYKTCQGLYLESKQQILQRDIGLKEMIEKKTETMTNELDKTWKEIQSVLEKETTTYNNKYSVVQKTSIQLDEIKEIKKADLLVSTFNQLQEQLPIVELQRQPLDIRFTAFSPGKESSSEISSSYGTFEEVPVPDSGEKIHFKINTSYSTHLRVVNKIVSTTNNTICLNDFKAIHFAKAGTGNGKLRVVKKVDIKIFDMVVLTQGKLIVSLRQESCLLEFNYPSKQNTFKSFPGLLPRGLHRTKENTIFVGLRETGTSAFPLSDKSQRKIVLLDDKGEQLQEYEFDKRHKRLFSSPRRIITNRNGDLCVLDGTAEAKGRVIQLSTTGEVNWVFEGHGSFNTFFNPWGIEVTARDNIVISDCSNDYIIVLSYLGQILKLEKSCDIGISVPFALHWAQPGKLWVGTDTCKYTRVTRRYEKFQDKANVYLLEVFGC